MRRPSLGRRRGSQDLAIARPLATIASVVLKPCEVGDNPLSTGIPGEVIPNSIRTPCRGERPSDGPDRQEEREEVTGGTHSAGKGPGRDVIARRSQKKR